MGGKEISAGGVVYRTSPSGNMDILMIQDRYGRVSLPKGKTEHGETLEQTALREIAEETGIEGEIIAPLARVTYRYKNRQGYEIDKEVDYYLVRAKGGELQAQLEEIDGVRWLSPESAWAAQRASGYSNNDDVLRAALKKLGVRAGNED